MVEFTRSRSLAVRGVSRFENFVTSRPFGEDSSRFRICLI
jgi:hypothetical protein